MFVDDIPHGFCISRYITPRRTSDAESNVSPLEHSEVVAKNVRKWVEEIIEVYQETLGSNT